MSVRVHYVSLSLKSCVYCEGENVYLPALIMSLCPWRLSLCISDRVDPISLSVEIVSLYFRPSGSHLSVRGDCLSLFQTEWIPSLCLWRLHVSVEIMSEWISCFSIHVDNVFLFLPDVLNFSPLIFVRGDGLYA